jgi:hypothetical protein
MVGRDLRQPLAFANEAGDIDDDVVRKCLMFATDRKVMSVNSRLLMWGGFAALLVTPLLAMRFTQEVQWRSSDFAAAAALLVAVGVVIELAVQKLGNRMTRLAIIGIAVAAGVAVWADAAVGVF